MAKKKQSFFETKYVQLGVLALLIIVGLIALVTLATQGSQGQDNAAAIVNSTKQLSVAFSVNGTSGNTWKNDSSAPSAVTITSGDTLTLSWNAQNASSCSGYTSGGFDPKAFNPQWNSNAKIKTIGSMQQTTVAGSANYVIDYYLSCSGKSKNVGLTKYVEVTVLPKLHSIQSVSLSYNHYSAATGALPIYITPNDLTLPYRYSITLFDKNGLQLGGVTLASAANGVSTYNWQVPTTLSPGGKFKASVRIYAPTGNPTLLASIDSPLMTLQ